MGHATTDPRPFVRVHSKDLRYLKHSGKQHSKESGTGQGLPRLLGHRPGPPSRKLGPGTASVGHRSLVSSLSQGGRRPAIRKPELMEEKEKRGVWMWTPDPQGHALSLPSPALTSLRFGKTVTVPWRPLPARDPPEAMAAILPAVLPPARSLRTAHLLQDEQRASSLPLPLPSRF